MQLNLTQLATFVRLATERNFTRTAAALDLTQPAVTQQIRALERDLGAQLVERGGRSIELTDIGTMVAERAQQLVRASEALQRDVRERVEVRAGVLHLGATVTIGGYALPAILARFAARFPGIRTEVTIDNTETIVTCVLDGRVSIALVEGAVVNDDLECTPFADDELIAIAPTNHPFAARARVMPSELVGHAFVSREAGSGTRATFVGGLQAAGIEPRIVLDLPTSEGIVRAVEAGLGLAVISRLVASDALAAGRVREIAIDGIDFRRRFLVVRRKLRTPSPAAAALMAAVLGEVPLATSQNHEPRVGMVVRAGRGRPLSEE